MTPGSGHRIRLALAAIVGLTVLGLLAAVLLGMFLEYLETPAVRYADRAEAVAAGAESRGWLPELVPDAAVDIREAHDLDTNEQWKRFRVAAIDAIPVDRSCAPLGERDPFTLDWREPGWPPWLPWWPSDLRDRVVEGELEMYVCDARVDPRTFLILDRDASTAYYHRNPP